MSLQVGLWAAVTVLTVVGIVAVVLRRRKIRRLHWFGSKAWAMVVGHEPWLDSRNSPAQFGGSTGAGRSACYRRWPGVLIVGLISALVGGCGMLTDLASLRGRITDAGYEQVQLNHKQTNGHDVVTVDALTPDERATDDDVEKIARIVWETYPRTVDELNITINGRHAGPFSRDELARAFGDRDPELDKGTGLGWLLLIGLLVVLTIAALVVVLVAVLVRRNRRASRAPDPPYPPYHSGAMYPQVPPSASPSYPAPPAPLPGEAQPPRRDE